MPDCEMCGKKTQNLIRVRIEGAVMSVCDSCQHFGTPLETKKPAIIRQPQEVKPFVPTKREVQQIVKHTPTRPRKKEADIENLYVVEEFPRLIKEAREKMSWTQEDLAKRLMERKNVLSNIERGALVPDIKFARKLEKILGISLVEDSS